MVLKYCLGAEPVFKANSQCNNSKLITLKLKWTINHFDTGVAQVISHTSSRNHLTGGKWEVGAKEML